jgi:hypothetical protein
VEVSVKVAIQAEAVIVAWASGDGPQAVSKMANARGTARFFI